MQLTGLLRLLRAGAAGLLAVSATGCGGPSEGLLATADAPAGTVKVDMLAATTRAVAAEPGVVFTGERGTGVSFANVVVSIPPGRPVGTVQWPRAAPGNPDTDFVATSVTPLAENRLGDWFRRASGRPRRVFVFVHGFNTRFDRAVFRFAQLAHDSDAQAAPVLFSWPSRGRILDYKRDFDNATYSRSDFARLIRAAARSPSVSEVTILAHSMGSWLAVEALRQIALQDRGVPSKVTNLILASPDLEIGVFRRQIEDMGPRRPEITLFVAQNDRALWLSRVVAGGVTRLGAIDLRQDAYREALSGIERVTVLDLSALQGGDRINHDLYAQSPAIVRLIGDRLIQGQVITDTDVSLPMAAGETIGAAAGFAIAAPVLIFSGSSSTQ